MKFRSFHFWILAVTFVAALIGSSVYYGQQSSTEDKILVFVTVGIDQTKLPAENSSYELQRASEHFSDVVLGWTVEPSFQEEFLVRTGNNYAFTGQRQEKQNLLFQSSAYDFVDGAYSTEGDALLSLLNDWIAAYNAKTNAGYVLAIQKVNFQSDVEVSTLAPKVGTVLLILALTAAGLLTHEYATTRRRSSSAA